MGNSFWIVIGDIQKHWHEKEASNQKDTSKPKVQSTPGTSFSAGGPKAEQIKTAYATPVLKDDGAKDKALVKYGTWTMTLAGHHLMPMNTFVNIRDFSDIDPDGIYQLCGLSLIDSGQLLKTVMTFRGDFTGISAGSVNQKQQTMIEEE
jgi:hypothetical protein